MCLVRRQKQGNNNTAEDTTEVSQLQPPHQHQHQHQQANNASYLPTERSTQLEEAIKGLQEKDAQLQEKDGQLHRLKQQLAQSQSE